MQNKIASFYGITMMLLVPLMFIHYMMLTTTSTTAYAATTTPSNESTSATQGSIGIKANASAALQSDEPALQEFLIPSGSRPHDVAPAPDGTVWYTAQGSGELVLLDPSTNQTHHIDPGQDSSPHGVIVGPDGAPWITDGGLNAIVRVDPATEKLQIFQLPRDSGSANLNTATFDQNGTLWFTGQNGIYGRLDLDVGQVEVFDAPRGRGLMGSRPPLTAPFIMPHLQEAILLVLI